MSVVVYECKMDIVWQTIQWVDTSRWNVPTTDNQFSDLADGDTPSIQTRLSSVTLGSL
jgi:hypothetical protein